jgi:hypothetical protein
MINNETINMYRKHEYMRIPIQQILLFIAQLNLFVESTLKSNFKNPNISILKLNLR